MTLLQPEPQAAPADPVDHALQLSEGTFRCVRMHEADDTGAVGGMPWVVWGIPVRVAASVTGHWLIGYFAHNQGPRSWHIEGAGVQGYNVPYCGSITMGEALHNKHHAFPGSARLGVKEGEMDPGGWVLGAPGRLDLVWNARTPEMLPHRPNLVSLRQ